MRKEDLWTICFAAIICVVCSLLLAFVADALKDRIATNKELDRKKNVLVAFGQELVVEKDGEIVKLSPTEILGIFSNKISAVIIDRKTGDLVPDMDLEGLDKLRETTPDEASNPTKLPVYLWKEGETITRYAFPQKGKGLWSEIKSYLALDKTLSEIIGVTFYGHLETPGLGGECSAPWFQKNFTGKKIWADGNYQKFEIVKGGVTAKYPNGSEYAVDGIGGATLTCQGIEAFMNKYIDFYKPYFDKVRKL